MTADLLVQARAALLDALAALREHRDAVVVIGAQAVYLRTPSAVVALAEATKDSDLAVDARVLGDEPLIEQAMRDAGFVLNPTSGQPGAWLTPTGVPVDLMVPELLAGPGGAQAREARVPPLADSLSREAGRVALDGVKEHAASGAQATICVMAGRAEEGIGEPATVALATSLLSQDLLAALGR